jgi:hypothetical protein
MVSVKVISGGTNTSSWVLVGVILVGVAFLTVSVAMLAMRRGAAKLEKVKSS